MFKRLFTVLVALMLVLAAVPASGQYVFSDAPMSGGGGYAFVRFHDPPLASYNGGIQGYDATKPAKGQKLDLNSPAAKKYGQRLEKQRSNYLSWLNMHHPHVQLVAEYYVTYNGVGLKLNGATIQDISGGPGVAQAGESAGYQKAMSASHDLIGSASLWNALGGQEGAGSGIMVGIIDSGVDQAHPFLNDTGMTAPAGFPKGDTSFTSNKVIVAKVFHQDPFYTAQAVHSHGTHVAGTVAGRAGTDAPLDTDLSGVAPGAWLGNYNVFPGNTGSAFSLFIAKAVEEAVIDGMDVLNLSLGGTAYKGADLLDMTVDAATDANVTVAIAAGNSGPGVFTVGSPGTAEKVITVAATTNSHSFAMFLRSVALTGGETFATTGTEGGEVTAELTGTYDVWADYAGGDKLACEPISGTPLAGKMALIQRGECTFTTKINNAVAAGAVAAIIYQRDDQNEPIPMATPGALAPAVMISRDAGYTLVSWTDDRSVTITHPPAEIPATPDLLASFSSWGPTPNYTLKPDVAAPGVNIYSSVVGGGFEAYQGTSMATPHVAGAAALLLAHSRANNLSWGPAEVKAALIGTARPAADTADPIKVGGGIINLSRAMDPPAMASPASVSFGLVRPVGGHTYSQTVTITNTGTAANTFDLADEFANVTISPTNFTLAPGASEDVTVTVSSNGTHVPGQWGYPDYVRGRIVVSSASGNIHIPYLYVNDYNR